MTGDDHDEADGDERQRQRLRPRRVGRRAGRRDDHRLRQGAGPERRRSRTTRRSTSKKTADRHLDHDQRAGRWPNGQYFGRITLDPKRNGATPVTIPVAFDKQQGAVTLTHDCAPTTFPQKTRPRALHGDASRTSAASPANVDLTVTNLDKGKGLDFTNISAPASSIKKDDGVQWSGTLTPALAPHDRLDHRRHRRRPDGGYLPLALLRRRRRSPASATTRSRTSTCRRSTTAASRTRRSASSRTATSWSAAAPAPTSTSLPQTFPNAARPNNVIAPFWTDLNPTGQRCGRHDPGQRPERRRQRLDRRRLGGRQELQQRRRRTLARSGSRSTSGRPAPARERGGRPIAYGPTGRTRQRGRRSGLRHELGRGEPRRLEREEHSSPAPAEQHASTASTRSPPTAGGSATITLRRLVASRRARTRPSRA